MTRLTGTNILRLDIVMCGVLSQLLRNVARGTFRGKGGG
jgi:hypothetical protein